MKATRIAPQFILCIIASSALTVSYFTNRDLWLIIDHKLFSFLNQLFLTNRLLTNGVALAVSSYAHNIHDIIAILVFTYYHIKSRLSLATTVANIVLIALLVLTAALCNGLLTSYKPLSKSPAIIFDNAILVSEHTSGIFHSLACGKESDYFSFPSGHGSTAVICTLCAFLFLGKNAGIAMTLQMILFLLPRLIVGRHYFSDIIPGSLLLPETIILIVLYFKWDISITTFANRIYNDTLN